MKKIKNITVGIDFSSSAVNAYRYASALAKTINATLTLVHVKENALIVSDVMVPSFSPEYEAEILQNIKKLIHQENGGNDIAPEVKIKIVSGNTVSVLTELPETSDTDLIVMGTTGSSDLATKLFGSTSLKVSNQAHCPVILVPKDSTWRPIQQLLFASDYDSMTTSLVTRITDFAENINGHLHFINVRNYDPILEPKQKDIDWDALVLGNFSDSSYKKSTIYGNDTVAELKKYSESNAIDLIVFSSKHRNFWTNLTHKSITKNMALSTSTPVMVMHLDDEA